MPQAKCEGGPAQAPLGGDQQEDSAEAEAEAEQRQGGRTEGDLAVGAEQRLAADQEQGQGRPPGAALDEGEQQAAMALEAECGLLSDAAEPVEQAAQQAHGEDADCGKTAAEQG